MFKVLFTACLFMFSSLSLAAEPKSKSVDYPEPTKEMRAKMADMHQQMATCLKSTKTFDECRDEMRGSCQEFGGMMHGGPGHKGHMHGMMTGFCESNWNQQKDSTTKEKTKK